MRKKIYIPEFADYTGHQRFSFDKNTYEKCGRPLGSGAHGVVYFFRATFIHPESQYKASAVAVKESINSGCDFSQEKMHWRKVYSHDYVPAQASRNFLLMPFIPHLTFKEILNGSLSITDIACYLIVIATALDELHIKHKIVHGDLWDFNVMLDLNLKPKPKAYLIDFGEARSIDHRAVLFQLQSPPRRAPYAPEVYFNPPQVVVLAKPSQDYYGFGFLIKTALEKIQKSRIPDSELVSKIEKMSYVGDQLQMSIPAERWNLKKAIFVLNALFISQPERPTVAQNIQMQSLVAQCEILAREIEKKSDAIKSEKLKGLSFLYVLYTCRLSGPQQAVNETRWLFSTITQGLFSRSKQVLNAVEKLPILPPPQPAVL